MKRNPKPIAQKITQSAAVWEIASDASANQHPTEITVQRAQLHQQAEIFWGGWWSLLLVSADKFSPSYSLPEPEYLTQAVVLTSLPLKQALHQMAPVSAAVQQTTAACTLLGGALWPTTFGKSLAGVLHQHGARLANESPVSTLLAPTTTLKVSNLNSGDEH